ncbi:hypothetical protein MJO29_016400 [Puccinia striiformis f. sp. tritici]|nr:hypothetical protein MJO29_016400 [Puccinia striiformis f. sp. tritici]
MSAQERLMNTYSPSQAYQRFNSSTAVLLKPHQPTKVVAVPLLPQRGTTTDWQWPIQLSQSIVFSYSFHSVINSNLVIVTIIYSLFIILTIQAVLRFITNQQKKQSGSEYCYHPTRSLLPTLLNLTLYIILTNIPHIKTSPGLVGVCMLLGSFTINLYSSNSALIGYLFLFAHLICRGFQQQTDQSQNSLAFLATASSLILSPACFLNQWSFFFDVSFGGGVNLFNIISSQFAHHLGSWIAGLTIYLIITHLLLSNLTKSNQDTLSDSESGNLLNLLMVRMLSCKFIGSLDFNHPLGNLSNRLIGLVLYLDTGSGQIFFDCMALGMGLFASVMAIWPADKQFTFGHGGVETLSGFANGVFLMLISVFIVFEAVQRLVGPPEMNTNQLLTVSFMGLMVNLVGIPIAFIDHHSSISADSKFNFFTVQHRHSSQTGHLEGDDHEEEQEDLVDDHDRLKSPGPADPDNHILTQVGAFYLGENVNHFRPRSLVPKPIQSSLIAHNHTVFVTSTGAISPEGVEQEGIPSFTLTFVTSQGIYNTIKPTYHCKHSHDLLTITLTCYLFL